MDQGEQEDIAAKMENSSHEMFNSWTIIKEKFEDSPEAKTPDIHQHHSEDSDGISIISDNEVDKINDIDSNNKEIHDTDEESKEGSEKHFPITPPTTPKIEENITSEPVDQVPTFEKPESFDHCQVNLPRVFLVASAFMLAASLLFSEFKSLRFKIQEHEERITTLEKENQLLKASLEKYQKVSMENLQFPTVDMDVDADTEEKTSPPPLPPATKSVWVGGEQEQKVEILDRKYNSLPDYCYHTDEDGLFYEHNKEICERKKQKLLQLQQKRREKMEKMNQQEYPRDISKFENFRSYDEYVQKTLNSLDDDVQRIIRLRGMVPENQQENEKPSTTGSDSSEKRRKFREKKKSKKDQQTSAEWIEKRMHGREDARKKHEKQKEDDVNWYLKRKNEREIDRIEV